MISWPDGDKVSGRDIVDTRGAEQVVEALDQGIDPLFRQCAHRAGKGLKAVGATPLIRALRRSSAQRVHSSWLPPMSGGTSLSFTPNNSEYSAR
jgi:hypothetical protein